jgi:hypothetical protein
MNNYQTIFDASNGVWDSEFNCYVKPNHPKKLKLQLSIAEQMCGAEIDEDIDLPFLCQIFNVPKDVNCCPICQGTEWDKAWENNGFDEPLGQSKVEVTKVTCRGCGYAY